MIKGEVRTIRRNEAATTAFTFDSTPTLEVSLPDGNLLSPNPTVQVTPATSALTQTMLATVSFSQAGWYIMRWIMDVGAQSSIIGEDDYFAAHTDVYKYIRDEMKLSDTVLTEAVIDGVLGRLLRQLNCSFSMLRNYDAFVTTQEKSLIDDTLIYLACIRLRTAGYMGAPSGQLIGWKFQQTEFRFNPNAGDSTTLSTEDKWFQQAKQAFQCIPEIASHYATRTSRWLGFSVSGPSRLRIADYGQSMFSNVASLLSDTVNFPA